LHLFASISRYRQPFLQSWPSPPSAEERRLPMKLPTLMSFYELQNSTASYISITTWDYAIGLAHRPESEFLVLMLIYYFSDPIAINIILEDIIV